MSEEIEDLDELEDEESSAAQEMYEHFRLEADAGQNVVRVDKFLVDRLPNASRTRVQAAVVLARYDQQDGSEEPDPEEPEPESVPTPGPEPEQPSDVLQPN